MCLSSHSALGLIYRKAADLLPCTYTNPDILTDQISSRMPLCLQTFNKIQLKVTFSLTTFPNGQC